MKKRFVLSLLCLWTSLVTADPIQTYQELASSMRAGNCFSVHLDLPKCTGNAALPLGYFIPEGMLLIPEAESVQEHIVTSYLHFTDFMGAATFEYVTCTFYPDNSVLIRILYYDPQNFQPKDRGQSIYCALGNGVSVSAK